ncbi:MAG: VWA domain-containing protein [Lentilitoribacter sp.]
MSTNNPNAPVLENVDGRLVDNIIYFCRTLRRAGVPVAPSQIKDLIRAIEVVGFSKKSDFIETLRACLITRPEQMEVFEQVFNLFWRDPEFINKIMQTLLPFAQNKQDEVAKLKAAENRAADAMTDPMLQDVQEHITTREELVLDAQFSFSQNERIAAMDFEQMTNAEVADAERAIAQLDFKLPKTYSRRYRTSPIGPRIDIRNTLHHSRKSGGELLKLIKKRRIERKPELVFLCDISGSMSTYSRMIMHFIYAIANQTAVAHSWSQVHAFTFGTKLTNISHLIKGDDPDIAFHNIGQFVTDWDGGTQIGSNIEQFNMKWSRRILKSDTVVILVTDGLERGHIELLDAQLERLKLSSGHIIWLNPLLRFDEFQPLARGIKTIKKHTSRLVSCHNINSLANLSSVVSGRSI